MSRASVSLCPHPNLNLVTPALDRETAQTKTKIKKCAKVPLPLAPDPRPSKTNLKQRDEIITKLIMGITLRLTAKQQGQRARSIQIKGRCKKHLQKQLGDALPPPPPTHTEEKETTLMSEAAARPSGQSSEHLTAK